VHDEFGRIQKEAVMAVNKSLPSAEKKHEKHQSGYGWLGTFLRNVGNHLKDHLRYLHSSENLKSQSGELF
jgi:hypothetical protein